ncbi:MAG: bifunctional diaminohydroxyphosphoribosylaminopyrimidine deaminase/5-amino-6-(5-phosphoribosylamino)uracil reductase RibD [Gammaproteobacteria bacterium]
MTAASVLQDEFFMARAVRLAQNGLYTTDPNPRVGCVLVRDGNIVAEGWHAEAGQGHAEVEALKQISDARGTTAYVTLEPCSHHGRTPPCCEALIRAGVSRVVAAMQDPNPQVAGRGLARLQAAGIEVRCGVLEQDARNLNPGFIKRMLRGLPYVRSKMAMSLDGRTAMANGESRWITSAEARADVHRIRARSSAIVTGSGTVAADDPSLTARIEHELKQPVRVVLDSTLKMSGRARMLSLSGRTLVITCADDRNKIASLQAAGAEVHVVSERNGRVDLHETLVLLGRLEFNEVLVEAGPTLNGALLDANLVDEWVVYMATCILGDQARGLFTLPGLTRMADKKQLNLSDVRQIGSDLRLILK